MRVHSLALGASMLFCLTNAAAQSGASGSYPASSDTQVQSVRIQPTPAQRVLDADPDAVSGQYRLSNGWVLKVEPGSSGIWTRIDRQRPRRLAAVAADTYASHDGNVWMRFDVKRDEMVMRYVPQDRLAGVIEVRATLAGR